MARRNGCNHSSPARFQSPRPVLEQLGLSDVDLTSVLQQRTQAGKQLFIDADIRIGRVIGSLLRKILAHIKWEVPQFGCTVMLHNRPEGAASPTE